jgi:hypothetical protein
MVTKILQPKVEAHGFVDLLAIGVVKNIEERITAPYIGNGTLWSGAVKGILGGVIDGHGGKVGKYLGGALGVDAGEDLANALTGMIGGGMGAVGGASASSDGW